MAAADLAAAFPVLPWLPKAAASSSTSPTFEFVPGPGGVEQWGFDALGGGVGLVLELGSGGGKMRSCADCWDKEATQSMLPPHQ